MVKKIFKIINREISGVHDAAYLLGFFAFLSQVLALVRDRLLAHYFGASHSLDIYYASFRIPDFLFASIASVVSISVLIPFLVEKMDSSFEEGKKFIQAVFSVFFLFIAVVSVAAFFLMPYLLSYFFPAFTGDDGAKLITMSRIILLSPILLGFSNFFASITQVYKRFFLYAMSPVLYNAGIIAGIVILYPIFGLIGLSYGVVLGALLHGVIQLPFIIEKGLFPRLTRHIDFTSVKKVLFLSLPRTITASSNEIAEFFLISFAALMSVGSISVFSFSFNLQSVPLAIVGVSYSLAAFPTLARYYAGGERQKFVEQMVTSAKHIIFWSVPVAMLFIVLRAQIVRVLLGSGNFDWTDTRLTAAALALFIISIVPQSLMPLFVRSYYARSQTRKPLLMNFASAFFLVVLAYFLMKSMGGTSLWRYFIEALLKVDGLSGTSVLMLPFAFSIGVTVNALLHWIDFHQDFPTFTEPVFRTLFQSLSASIIMGFVSYLMLGVFGNFVDMNTAVGVFLQGFLSGISGILVYLFVLILLKSLELAEVWSTFHRKFWKTKVIVEGESPL